MTAYTCAMSSNQSGYCGTYAAAGTSMRLERILGTAVAAVSVFIVRFISLLVWKV